MAEPARRPGRDGAVEALVRAARELFAERGPSAVSLRDVARRAGVNHGLIHHYIGSRDDLIRLVFAASSESARAEVAGHADLGEALARLRQLGEGSDDYARLLAWALLEGRDPAEFHGRSPALAEIMGAVGDDSRATRLLLAIEVVQVLGWKLFGNYVVDAVGLDGEPADVRHEAHALLDRLLVPAADRVAP